MNRFFVLFLLITHCLSLLSQEFFDGKINNKPTYTVNKKSSVSDYINIYQKYISGMRNSSCGMYPSCSNYGLIVFNDRPFFEAMTLTSDRIVRCSHDRNFYDQCYEYGDGRILDYPSWRKLDRRLIYKSKEVFSGDSHPNDDLKFINFLINDNHYESALLEINRLCFLKQDLFDDLNVRKMICYQALGREEDGIYEYESSLKHKTKNPDIALKVAKLYYNIDNYEDCRRLLSEVSCIDTLYKPKVLLMNTMISLRLNDIESANKYAQESLLISNSLNNKLNLEIIESIGRAKFKKPIIAKLLSVIPGCGYAYTGHTKTAITSLLVNGALGYATFTSIKSKNYGLAVLMGFMNISFYIGNIRGAGKSANRYNNSILEKGIIKISNNSNFTNY